MKKLIVLIVFLSITYMSNAQTVAKLDVQKTIEVQLYPNPTVNYLNINFDAEKFQNVEFEMYSLIGSKLEFVIEKKADNHYKIPVDKFGSGYYLLIVKDRNQSFKKAYKFQKL